MVLTRLIWFLVLGAGGGFCGFSWCFGLLWVLCNSGFCWLRGFICVRVGVGLGVGLVVFRCFGVGVSCLVLGSWLGFRVVYGWFIARLGLDFSCGVGII